MATLVHPSSAKSTNSQLDLFSVPPSQTSLEEGSFTEYHPVSVLTSTGPIEFTISAKNSNYINLANSFFYMRASVTTAAGADLAKNVEIVPECNFLHTLWTQVDVYLNGSLVTQSNNNYPYQAYIENLLSFGQEAKKSQLSALFWHRNTSEHFDTRGATNLGYTKRKALAAESKEIDMLGKLHLDLFFQNQYLLNSVEVRLRLIRSNDLFCLHGNANQADNKVTLFVRKVKPNPAVQLAHVKALQYGTAKYPLVVCNGFLVGFSASGAREQEPGALTSSQKRWWRVALERSGGKWIRILFRILNQIPVLCVDGVNLTASNVGDNFLLTMTQTP